MPERCSTTNTFGYSEYDSGWSKHQVSDYSQQKGFTLHISAAPIVHSVKHAGAADSSGAPQP